MDTIEGLVINVLDGDTFDLDVDRVGRSNGYEYNDVERVRLAGVNAPELAEPGGRAAHTRLRTAIQGRRVRVDVRARDRYGRIVGTCRLAA